MNDETIRDQWISGQKCEIYSLSKEKWFTGKIADIFIDDEGEWLEIKYNKSCTKQVQRFSINIRPHPKYYGDEDRSKSLIDGYIRMIQYQFSFWTMIPKELNILLFAFYFAGHDILSDDEEVSDDYDSDTVEPEHIDDEDSASPSPHDQQLVIEYLRKQIEERKKRATFHLLYGRRQTHSFMYPATLKFRRRKQLYDIHEQEPMTSHIEHIRIQQQYQHQQIQHQHQHQQQKQFHHPLKQQQLKPHTQIQQQPPPPPPPKEFEQIESSDSDEDEDDDLMMQLQDNHGIIMDTDEEEEDDEDEMQQNLSSESRGVILMGSDWRRDMLRDDILCTMSEILFECGTMFKTMEINRLITRLRKQVIDLKEVMNMKKEYREELLIFGFIRIQISLINKDIPIDIKTLCLSYY